MEDNLKITLVQTDNTWENIDVNLERLSSKIDLIDGSTDLIILPELFSTGFTMEASGVAETMEGLGIEWMKKTAKKTNSLIIGSLLIEEGGVYFNRLISAFPDGDLLHYDKRHLFSYAGEDKVFTAGNDRLVFTYKGFTICPLICYDLRFPVWCRNTENIDLLIFVANWPNARMTAWDTLLKARSIENLCYVAAVNRVGTDNNDLMYTGHTSVYDPMGEELLKLDKGEEVVRSITLSKNHIGKVRSQFRFLEDRDEFKIV